MPNSDSQNDNRRPRRDVSARSAVGECTYCEGNANSLLGGEHIWKCSEIVVKAQLRELVDEWRDEARTAQERLDDRLDEGKDVDYNDAKERNLRKCADELEALIE